MRCPFCGGSNTRVLDSRPTDEDRAVRRRRECDTCGERFTTYEKVELMPYFVVKQDGRRERFDRDKVLGGLIKACEKRPVSIEAMEKLVTSVERELQASSQREIPSKQIGQMVMERLRDLDEVAYVRFASVYRRFADIQTFRQELERLLPDEE